jgi:hypothetical protein
VRKKKGTEKNSWKKKEKEGRNNKLQLVNI